MTMLNACSLAAEKLVIPEALVLATEDLKPRRFPVCQLLSGPVGTLVVLHAGWQGQGSRTLPASLLMPGRNAGKRS